MGIRTAIAITIVGLGPLGPVSAQEPRYIVLPRDGRKPASDPVPEKPKSENRTRVSVEILTGRLGGGAAAQKWARLFQDIGYEGRMRQSRPTDELGVFETNRGRLRDVRVVGRLDDDGSIRFADRRVRLSDANRLKEWLGELKTFGEQGAPVGQPLWGLNRAQFERVHRELSVKLNPRSVGQPVRTAVGNLGTPATLPIRISEDARPILADVPRSAVVSEELSGLTVGTALAILLREHALGFRPTRTPDGSLELAVVPLAKTSDVWGIGWDFEGSRQKAMPKMFAFVPVRLDDSQLTDVLDVIATTTEVPILLDTHGIGTAGIDLDALRTSYPPKTTSWSLLLRNILGPHKLIRDFRTDEAGTVFCWVTVFRPRPISDE